MAPKFKDPDDKIPCSSPAQLQAHVETMATLFLQPESEHTWERFAKALDKLAALTRGGAARLESFPTAVGPANGGGLGDKIVQCVLSERAALSRPAVELVTALAVALGREFSDRLQRLYVPPLLDLIRRTNNIVRERAEHALFTVIRACPLPSLLTPLATASRDANPKLRRAVCSATTLTVVHWKAGGRADEVEGMIKVLAEDRDEGVRKAARELWDKYKVTWPERVPAFIGPLSPAIKKRLDIKETDSYPPRELSPSTLNTTLSASTNSESSPSTTSPSAAAATAGGDDPPFPQQQVPVKKMGAKSFIALRKAELARQALAAKAAAAAATGGEGAGSKSILHEEPSLLSRTPLLEEPMRSAADDRREDGPCPTGSSSFVSRSPPATLLVGDVVAETSSSSSSSPVNVAQGPFILSTDPRHVASPPSMRIDREELPSLPPSFGPSTPVKATSRPLSPSISSPTSPSSSFASSPGRDLVAADASTPMMAVKMNLQPPTGQTSPQAGSSTPIRPPRSEARRPSATSSVANASSLGHADAGPSVTTPLRPSSARLTSTSLEAEPSTPTPAATESAYQEAFATPLTQKPPLTGRSAALRNAAAFADSPAPTGAGALSLGNHHVPKAGTIVSGSASSPRHRDLLDGGAAREQRELADWRRLKAGLSEVSGGPSGSSSSMAARPMEALLDRPGAHASVGTLLAFSAAHPVGQPLKTHAALGFDLAEQDGDDGESELEQAASRAHWEQDGLFANLLERLLDVLKADGDDNEDEAGRCLVLVESLVEHQRPLLGGREGDLVSALLDLRRRPAPSSAALRQGTTHVLSLILNSPMEPVVALFTLGTSLRTLIGPSLLQSLLEEDASTPAGFPPVRPASSSSDDAAAGPDGIRASAASSASAFAFGLVALGRTLLRLPAEVVAEELPRLRDLLLLGLYSAVLVVRESAATAILAAQLVIGDEALVFSLLERLTADKVNLLTYLFEKNKLRDPPRVASAAAAHAGASGRVAVNGSQLASSPSSRERLERELRRLSLQP